MFSGAGCGRACCACRVIRGCHGRLGGWDAICAHFVQCAHCVHRVLCVLYGHNDYCDGNAHSVRNAYRGRRACNSLCARNKRHNSHRGVGYEDTLLLA
jgi:hypothetical protein